MTFPNLHPDIPETVRRAYDLTISSVTAVSGGFSGATVFRVLTVDGRTLAIRQTPNAATLPAKRRIRLRGLLSQLAELGLKQIPVPLIPNMIPGGLASGRADPAPKNGVANDGTVGFDRGQPVAGRTMDAWAAAVRS